MRTKSCQIEYCSERHYARGCCLKHYYKVVRKPLEATPRPPRKLNKGIRCLTCANPARARGYCMKCYDHAFRDQRSARMKLNYIENRGAYRARKLRRKEATRLATPPWSDMAKINQIYRKCPKGHHVDHIVPLQGENVCGLHVYWNLQYLPAEENIRKSNRLRDEDAGLIKTL